MATCSLHGVQKYRRRGCISKKKRNANKPNPRQNGCARGCLGQGRALAWTRSPRMPSVGSFSKRGAAGDIKKSEIRRAKRGSKGQKMQYSVQFPELSPHITTHVARWTSPGVIAALPRTSSKSD